MKAPSFWREAGVALGLSVAGGFAFLGAREAIGSAWAFRGAIVFLGAAYLVALLRGLGARIGHVVTMAAWLAVTVLLVLVDPPILLWLSAEVVLIWLARSLHAYESLLAAMADAVLSGFALVAAAVTAVHTGSVFLVLWCFFIVEALFVLIPKSRAPAAAEGDGFERAYRTAEAAIRHQSSRSR